MARGAAIAIAIGTSAALGPGLLRGPKPPPLASNVGLRRLSLTSAAVKPARAHHEAPAQSSDKLAAAKRPSRDAQRPPAHPEPKPKPKKPLPKAHPHEVAEPRATQPAPAPAPPPPPVPVPVSAPAVAAPPPPAPPTPSPGRRSAQPSRGPAEFGFER